MENNKTAAMSERLKRRLEAAGAFATERLQRLDMGAKGANITAAKLQARTEAFQQAVEWAAEEEATRGDNES